MQTDEELMAAASEGKLEHLSELYRRYRRPLFGYFINQGVATDLAEDLLQATFERVIKHRETYRIGGSFRSWVFAIARNAMYKQHQRAGRIDIKQDVQPASLALSAPCAQTQWEQRETGSQTLAALAALPDAYREVVDLAWKRGLKYAEIATVLNISEANVKVRVHRAVKQLRVNYAKLDAQ